MSTNTEIFPLGEAAEQPIDPAVADIMVQCPIPEHQAEPMPFAKFIETDAGKNFGTQALKTAEMLEGAGIEKEAAIVQALGAAVVRNETGEIVRVPESLEQPDEPKKKL